MPTRKFFQIEMLRAAHGDCLWLEYGTAARTRRILIDGGPIGRWESLESRIGQLKAGASTFELIVLTHVDTDHVDGLVPVRTEKKYLEVRHQRGLVQRLEALAGSNAGRQSGRVFQCAD